MGKVHYSAGIDYVTGALDTKHELVARLKHLHDTNGALTKTCAPEIYLLKHKRNYEQTPPQGNELAHLQHFGDIFIAILCIVFFAPFLVFSNK